MGDEICVAKQDLVLAIDSSGSLKESGCKIRKRFTAKLLDKYMGMYFGYQDGIKSDGSVADAVDVIGLTSDMDKVKMAVESMSFLKSFTSMARWRRSPF